MKKTLACLATAMLLLGCVPATQTGGAGVTNRGTPVAGLLTASYRNNLVYVNIRSPGGWSCTAQFPPMASGQVSVTAPLECSDKRRGTLIVTLNGFQNQAVGSFTFSNGEAGQVTFGRT